MAYPGQIPGIGAPGTAGDDFTRGVDLGYGWPIDPTQGGTLTVELPPGTYPTPGGGTVTQPPLPPGAGDPPPGEFIPGTDDWFENPDSPGYVPPEPPDASGPSSNPYPYPGGPEQREPGTGTPNPLDPNEGIGPPVVPRYGPGPPIIFESGPPQPPASPVDPSIFGQRRARAPRRGGYSFPTPFPTLPEAVPPANPDQDETDRERPPLFPPDEEPANDTSIRRPPVQQVEPVRIPDPAGVRAPFPQPPNLPRVPAPPRVAVPTPEVPTWPKPEPFPTPTLPRTIPSTPSPVTLPRSTPSPATPSSSTNPALNAIVPLIGALLGLTRSPGLTRFVSPSLPTAPAIPSPSSPIASPITAPISPPSVGVSPVPVPAPIAAPVPGLTPFTSPGVESAPGQSCETPGQTRQRRQNQRDNCERFITIVVPKHKRRVCAAEAGRILGRKLGRKIGAKVGKELRGALKRAGVPQIKLPKRRKRIPRDIEIGGGFGIEIPKELRR